MHLTITVNFSDGYETELESKATDLADISSAVAHVLLEHKLVTYSSLVIVAVPEGEAMPAPQPRLAAVA